MTDRAPCLDAAARAEVEWGLPSGVLTAIGRIESGRWNPRTNQVEPWPWTVNAAGAGRYHPVLQDAIADVAREQAAGVRSVDVGCFQVNLLHHPAAFANLAEAFDPLANARYAARFLTFLRSNAGTWDLAVAQYHSALPEIGEPYRQRVMATWLGGVAPTAHEGVAPMAQGGVMPMTIVPPLSNSPSGQFDRRRATAAGDPHVIMVRASLNLARRAWSGLLMDPHVIRVHG